MAKGFHIPKEQRAERDATIDSRHDRREDEPDPAFGWAVANKPGAVPIGTNRQRVIGQRLKGVYDSYKNEQRRINPHFKLGRHTLAAPHNRNPQKKETLSERSKGEPGKFVDIGRGRKLHVSVGPNRESRRASNR